jgi:GH24 family phage-related lysozyme (muramidase)
MDAPRPSLSQVHRKAGFASRPGNRRLRLGLPWAQPLAQNRRHHIKQAGSRHMAMTPEVKAAVAATLETYEGWVNHLYVDSTGNVTVGVGHLVADKASATGLPLYKLLKDVPGEPASAKEKESEFSVVAALQKGYRAAWYKKHTSLAMKDGDIARYRDDHIADFHAHLVRIYTRTGGYPADFDDLPTKVQQALFDMIFNVGPAGVTGKFKNFDAALKAGDWKKAATESHRPQVAASRNDYVKALLLGAADEAAKQ